MAPETEAPGASKAEPKTAVDTNLEALDDVPDPDEDDLDDLDGM